MTTWNGDYEHGTTGPNGAFKMIRAMLLVAVLAAMFYGGYRGYEYYADPTRHIQIPIVEGR